MFEGLFSRFKRDTVIKESDEDLSLDEKNVITEIKDFMASKKRQNMIIGERYYDGKHDILSRKRTVIGDKGELEEVKNVNVKIKLIEKFKVKLIEFYQFF